MVDLQTLLLVVAILALWAHTTHLARRLQDVEAILDDHDDELEYMWDYQNERWQVTAEQFQNIDAIFSQMFGPDHEPE
jgi:hypothetical protein